MARIVINLRSKYLFFGASGLTFMYLLIHINMMTSAIDIFFLDKIAYLILLLFTAGFFWVPYQFNEQFT